MLAERVRTEAKATRASGAPGPGTRKALLKLIARRRKRLRRRALREGRRVFARSPKSFVRRVRAAAALGRSVDAEDRQLARAFGQRD